MGGGGGVKKINKHARNPGLSFKWDPWHLWDLFKSIMRTSQSVSHAAHKYLKLYNVSGKSADIFFWGFETYTKMEERLYYIMFFV